MSAEQPTEPKVEETKVEETKVEETKPETTEVRTKRDVWRFDDIASSGRQRERTYFFVIV
jgi:hypothetical protein